MAKPQWGGAAFGFAPRMAGEELAGAMAATLCGAAGGLGAGTGAVDAVGNDWHAAGSRGGFWLLWTLAGEREGRWSGVHLLVLLYWGIALLATVLSPVPRAAMVGLSKLTLYLLFFALAERVMRNERWRSRLLTVYLLTALLVSVEGIRQWILGRSRWRRGQIQSRPWQM